MQVKEPTLNNYFKHSGILLFSFFLFFSFFIQMNPVFSQKAEQEVDPKVMSQFKKAGKYYKNGKSSYSKGDLKKADKNFKKCLEIYPEHASSYYYLSKMSFQEGNIQKAQENIEKAKKNYTTYVTMNRALFRKNMKKFSENMNDLKLESDRGSVSSRTSQSDAMKESQKHMSKAQENFKNYSASIDIVLSDYHYLHGSIYYKQANVQETINEFLQAVKLNPKHNLVYNNLASIYYTVKEYQKASDIIKQGEANGVEINPKLKEALKSKINQ